MQAKPEVQGILLSDYQSAPLQWLWQKRIPLGQLTILDGDPSLGKSLLTLDLAARITTGRPMPDGTPGFRGNVLLIAPEDNVANTIKPRIEAAGGDPSRIRLFNFVQTTSRSTGKTDSSPFSLAEHTRNLIITILQIRSILVILDPLTAILGSRISVSCQRLRNPAPE